MAEGRLQRTREAYLCGRVFVITPWRHCSCRGCEFARRAPQGYRQLIYERQIAHEFAEKLKKGRL